MPERIAIPSTEASIISTENPKQRSSAPARWPRGRLRSS
jgi:hypothetical protein